MTALAVAALVAAPGTARASDEVTVDGVGSVPVKPDMMAVHAGVEVHRPAVRDAYQGVAAAAQQMITALEKAGVAQDDIRTAGLSVQPEYAKNSTKVTGYRGTEDVNATLRNLSRADATLAAAASTNEMRLYTYSFDVSDFSKQLAEARDKAFADARAKAEQYAKLSGRKLGRLISASESTVDPIPTNFYTADSLAGKANPVNPGVGQSTVHAHLVYALVP